MNFNFQNTTLSEATQGTNSNPPRTPYERVNNTDTLDSYPSLMKGLVYVSGDVDVSRTTPCLTVSLSSATHSLLPEQAST